MSEEHIRGLSFNYLTRHKNIIAPAATPTTHATAAVTITDTIKQPRDPETVTKECPLGHVHTYDDPEAECLTCSNPSKQVNIAREWLEHVFGMPFMNATKYTSEGVVYIDCYCPKVKVAVDTVTVAPDERNKKARLLAELGILYIYIPYVKIDGVAPKVALKMNILRELRRAASHQHFAKAQGAFLRRVMACAKELQAQ